MTGVERVGLLAYARTPAFARRVERANAGVREWLSRCERPLVAFSGGKDSTVMLHLVREQAPGCPALFSDDEYSLPETVAYLATVPNLHRIAAQIQHAAFFTSWADGPSGLPEGTEWIEDAHGDGAGTWQRANGIDGVAVGLRADENSYRRVHIRTRGDLFWRAGGPWWQVYPVAWWSVTDVWAYIVSRGLAYNRAYDRLSEVGVSRRSQRIGPFANWRALGVGQLAVLRAGWPAEFERFAAAHPEAHWYA